MIVACSTPGARPSCCALTKLAPAWRAALALSLAVPAIQACAPGSATSPPAASDASVYVAEDGRELLPLRLSAEGWQALDAADPQAANDLDRVNLIALCIAGLGLVDDDRRALLCET
ncbi:MAG: hypothetical protein ACJA1L_000003 [Paracoccaceae bacterium]|jgi:hypothetical protein